MAANSDKNSHCFVLIASIEYRKVSNLLRCPDILLSEFETNALWILREIMICEFLIDERVCHYTSQDLRFLLRFETIHKGSLSNELSKMIFLQQSVFLKNIKCCFLQLSIQGIAGCPSEQAKCARMRKWQISQFSENSIFDGQRVQRWHFWVCRFLRWLTIIWVDRRWKHGECVGFAAEFGSDSRCNRFWTAMRENIAVNARNNWNGDVFDAVDRRIRPRIASADYCMIWQTECGLRSALWKWRRWAFGNGKIWNIFCLRFAFVGARQCDGGCQTNSGFACARHRALCIHGQRIRHNGNFQTALWMAMKTQNVTNFLLIPSLKGFEEWRFKRSLCTFWQQVTSIKRPNYCTTVAKYLCLRIRSTTQWLTHNARTAWF